MKKAKTPKEAEYFEQIPNVGKETAKDFKLLGFQRPEELASQDACDLYVKLCKKTNSYHDPCVVDVFLAAIDFMDGKCNRHWWEYSEKRKNDFLKNIPSCLSTRGSL